MRTARADGLSVHALAKQFGVHRGTVWAKTRGWQSWTTARSLAKTSVRSSWSMDTRKRQDGRLRPTDPPPAAHLSRCAQLAVYSCARPGFRTLQHRRTQ